MKKALAIVLALVIALSASAMAFAATNVCPVCGATFESEKDYNAHLAICNDKVCPKCNRVFRDEAAYNKHVAECTVGDTEAAKDYVDLTVKEILNMIVDLAKAGMTQWNEVESVVLAIIDLIQNMGDKVIGTAEVDGAIAQLDGMNIPGATDLINALKQKIKDLYACEEATEAEETTAAEAAPETGSASTGIAVFAAISVAAAAAYVCTKKRA